MNFETTSVILAAAGVLIGVWRIMAMYKNRQDQAHAELGSASTR